MIVYLLLVVIAGPPKLVGPPDITIDSAVYSSAEKCLEAQNKNQNANVRQSTCLKKEIRK